MADTTNTSTTTPVTNATNTANGASTQHGLAPWIQPYVQGPQGYLTIAQQYVQDQLNTTYPGGGRPYEYAGQLVAGPSALQSQAFQGIGNLVVPQGVNAGMDTANVAAGNLVNAQGYQGQNFVGQGAYAPGQFDSGYNPERYNSQYNPEQFKSNFQSGNFTNSYQAGQAGGQYSVNDFSQVQQFNPADISTGQWNTQAAQQYMNPYLQQSLDPQLDQARRQAEITRNTDAARLAQAGAFGGSRQAIMESESNRNLLRNMADITGKGYFDAYNTGMQGFMTDQSRALDAAKAAEQSRQFGAGFGMDIAKANEASRQFLTTSELQRFQEQERARQTQATLGLEAQKGTEQSRQFQANNLLDAYKASQQALQAAEGYRGDAYKMSEQAMQAKGQMTLDAQRAAEASRQFGATNALDRQRAQEASSQFGANYGLDTTKAALQAAQVQSQLGLAGLNAQSSIYNTQMQAGDTQRAITQSQNQAAYDEWLRRLEYPMEMAKFQQSMMSGLPVSAITTQQPQLSGIAQLVASLAGAGLLTQGTNIQDLMSNLGLGGLLGSLGLGGDTGDGGAAEQAATDTMYPGDGGAAEQAATDFMYPGTPTP